MRIGHTSEKDIRKIPWVDIMIGLVGMVLFGFLTFVAARDTLSFSRQASPQSTDVESLRSDGSFERKWVMLTNFKLDCKTVEQTMRTGFLGKLILGPVYDTYIVIRDPSGREKIVAIFHGDVSCQSVQNEPLTGILTTREDYSYGVAFLSTRLSSTTNANLILRVGEDLAHSQKILAMGVIFEICCLLLILRSVRRWLV